MQVEGDLGDLDDAQVTEPGRKRWKEDNVAMEMLTRCAEDADGRAAAELKAITSRLLQDALVEKLTGLVKAVSDSVHSKINNP